MGWGVKEHIGLREKQCDNLFAREQNRPEPWESWSGFHVPLRELKYKEVQLPRGESLGAGVYGVNRWQRLKGIDSSDLDIAKWQQKTFLPSK